MPRPLTAHELEVRDQRRAQLAETADAVERGVEELRQRLDVASRGDVRAALPRALAPLQGQGDPMERIWWLSRVGYFVAAWLRDEHGGRWLLDEDPDSRFFLRPVIGGFAPPARSEVRFDPFQVAAALVDEGEPFEATLEGLAEDLR